MPGGWEWLIIIVVLVVLFGAKRLPEMARSVGQSARVFKGEMKGLRDDGRTTDATDADTRPADTRPSDIPPPAALPPAQGTTGAPGATQAGAAQPETGRRDAER